MTAPLPHSASSASSPTCPWRQALVIGGGASGLAAAALLLDLGVAVRVYDRRPEVALPPGAEPFLGEAAPPAAAFAGVELVVLSPGVPPGPIRALAGELAPSAAIHGELSLSLALLQGRLPDLPTVLITGTNGKSTVTALTGALLRAAGRDPFVGGNLGVPLASGARAFLSGERRPPDSLVLECSSFQLETLHGAGIQAATVAMVLNITPDHLDRYPDLATYAATKARIFGGLGPGGLALVDADDPFTAGLRQAIPAGPTVLAIGGDAAADPRLGEPVADLDLGEGWRFPRSALPLAGRHNAKNALFAVAAARHLGASAAACAAGLAGFVGLPHRMSAVAEVGGVAYFNDSKATNVASVIASLGGFERPFVLIAGGRAKGDDLGPLRALLGRGARALVAIGEAADAFAAAAEGVVPWVKAGSMAEAVAAAQAQARPGDAVILSPACASYDWYRNFAERGEDFARAVAALEG